MMTCVLSHGISRPSKINGTVAFPNSTNSDFWWFQENMWKDTWSQHVPTSTSRNFKTFLGFFSDFQCGSVHGAFGDLATGAKLVIFMEVSINGGTSSYHHLYQIGIFHYKPSILGIPNLWKLTCIQYMRCILYVSWIILIDERAERGLANKNQD